MDEQDSKWLARVLDHVREEYDEMPGLCLTPPQAERLWALDVETCRQALSRMAEMGYLQASPHGYVRAL